MFGNNEGTLLKIFPSHEITSPHTRLGQIFNSSCSQRSKHMLKRWRLAPNIAVKITQHGRDLFHLFDSYSWLRVNLFTFLPLCFITSTGFRLLDKVIDVFESSFQCLYFPQSLSDHCCCQLCERQPKRYGRHSLCFLQVFANLQVDPWL